MYKLIVINCIQYFVDLNVEKLPFEMMKHLNKEIKLFILKKI